MAFPAAIAFLGALAFNEVHDAMGSQKDRHSRSSWEAFVFGVWWKDPAHMGQRASDWDLIVGRCEFGVRRDGWHFGTQQRGFGRPQHHRVELL